MFFCVFLSFCWCLLDLFGSFWFWFGVFLVWCFLFYSKNGGRYLDLTLKRKRKYRGDCRCCILLFLTLKEHKEERIAAVLSWSCLVHGPFFIGCLKGSFVADST